MANEKHAQIIILPGPPFTHESNNLENDKLTFRSSLINKEEHVMTFIVAGGYKFDGDPFWSQPGNDCKKHCPMTKMNVDSVFYKIQLLHHNTVLRVWNKNENAAEYCYRINLRDPQNKLVYFDPIIDNKNREHIELHLILHKIVTWSLLAVGALAAAGYAFLELLRR